MTHEELFSAFPRPWHLSEDSVGIILDANGGEVLVIDRDAAVADDIVQALCGLLVEMVAEDGEE